MTQPSIVKKMFERAISRRSFMAGAGATAALLGSPIILSNTIEAAPAGTLDVTLPPPIQFPNNGGIGAQFNSYQAPSVPYVYSLKTDLFDRCYFPGQTAQLALTFTNPGGPPPAPWKGQDIGGENPGAVYYGDGKFTINGSGDDVWGSADGFYFVSQSVTGDATIIAHVDSIQAGDSWAKSGVMIRETTDAGSTHVDMFMTQGNGVAFQWRDTTNGGTNNALVSTIVTPAWVKLVRSGNTFTGFASPDGTTWTQVGSATVAMASTVLIGLVSCAHNNGAVNTSVFDNVSVNGVLTNGASVGGSFTVSGNIVFAFSTEVILDTYGGVQLTPVSVTKVATIPATTVDAGKSATVTLSYDFSDPNALKGIYAIFANFQDTINPGKTTQIWLGNLALINPPVDGFREKSPFMCDTSTGTVEGMKAEYPVLRKMGCKWSRNGLNWGDQEPSKGVYDWTEGDQIAAVLNDNQFYMIWLSGGSPDWARDGVTYPARTGSSEPDVVVPDDHMQDWHDYWVEFAKRYQNTVIKAINVWNEPWEGGGVSGWGGTGLTYRKMSGAVFDAVKSVAPAMKVGGDDSDDNINDILLVVPEWPKLFDLGTQHGIGPVGYYMQKILPFEIWQTESWYMSQTGMIVQETMFSLAGGRTKVNNVILGNYFTGAGDAGGYYSYDPNRQISPQPSLAAYSNMTHLLEDTDFVGEAHAGKVPFTFLFQGNNKPHVAVMFGFPTTPSWTPQWQITGAGKMRVRDPQRQITALDVYGNPYKREADGSYILPFDISPVYLTATTMDALIHATDGVEVLSTNTPAQILVEDITSPLETQAEFEFRIRNVLHQELGGTVTVTLPTGWSADHTSFHFDHLASGDEKTFTCRLLKAAYNDTNKYPVTITFTTSMGTMVWQENVEVHVITYGTPVIGKGAAQDEWKRLGVHPILIGNLTDPAYALVGLSYDDTNLYFIGAVNSPDLNPPYDQTGTWYTLIPPGYGYADGPHWPFDGDTLQLALNCYDNVEDYLYPAGHPYHYRYPSRETDYLFGFYWPKETNGQVWRYRIPGFPWRHRYPFTPFEVMRQTVDPDIKLTVTQNGTWYTYWAVIPLSLLSKLNAQPGVETKLAIKHSNSHVGDVYSSQNRSVSRQDAQAFQPYWAGAYSVDTRWGFGQKKKQ